MTFFDLRIRWAGSSDFGQKSDDLGRRILNSDFVTSDSAISDSIRKPDAFLKSKRDNLKLGIGSRKNQPEADAYPNPIPSCRFWSGRKNDSRSCKSKQASCAKSDAEMLLGSLVCLLVRSSS